MRIVSIGGGPAGLYFGILMKKLRPDSAITVYERNRSDDTFGWGVVFSDETLDHLERADPESFREIQASFKYWERIETHYRGECVVSTGHGFCGLSRKRLLTILHDRCRELGIELVFETEIESLDPFADADLIIGADGVSSMVRDRLARHFEPSIDWRRCRFAWFGTDKPLEAFTFVFKESPHGLFQVHAYPFEQNRSTWIVECREEVWRKAGLDVASEEESVAYCEELFAGHLDGHRLLTNRSVWRAFPTVRNGTLHHGNVVLLGDAAHTAHFSIGSGTKLAMEDAIALEEAFETHGDTDLSRTLEAYQDARHVDVIKKQKAAQTSLEWFENSARYQQQHPLLFTFNLMTRSKRITFDNLELRDPELVRRAVEQYAREVDAPRDSAGRAPVPMFTPYRLRDMQLANRVVVSPMCQYSASDGLVGDWHLVHLGSRAIGGAGLVMTEMTNVSADGRITRGCAGMYDEAHMLAWKRIVDFVHGNSRARIGIQLAHAGRKGSCWHPWEGADVPLLEDGWQTIGPSALPFDEGWPVPRAMDRSDMDRVREAFVRSTGLAERAGFDILELHMAHGYLLSSFISPLSNRRQDEYGGSLEQRMRYPLEVFQAVRAAWPEHKPMSVRISATDWVERGGLSADDSVIVARMLRQSGLDIVDVSSAGNSPESQPVYGRMYQVPFAEKIRYEARVPVMTVGAVLGADHCNTILAAGRADLCCLARPHLRDAYLTLHAAEVYGFGDQYWPGQYLAGKPNA
ncbi:MAG: bifunctional salicylyl-CoA 5-hydroxylase/oxidoreductase [Planctomycetota bacterium]